MSDLTYDDAADAAADKAQQLSLLTALNGWDRALRRDECGAWRINGSRGTIYTWGEGSTWVLFVACRSVRHWTATKKALGFCSVTQDGDDEGCLRQHDLPTVAQAIAIRDALGIRKRVELDAEELERRRTLGNGWLRAQDAQVRRPRCFTHPQPRREKFRPILPLQRWSTPMRIEMPMPPSVNSIWRSAGRGRVYRSKRYQVWRTTAGWGIKAQRPVPIAGWVRITISLGLTKRRSDADNRIKALLDSLVEHHLIEDDSKVASVSVTWSNDVPPGRVQVEVKRARAPKRHTEHAGIMMSSRSCGGSGRRSGVAGA